MAALDFPPSPTPGTVYGKYTWDGEKWGITPTAGGGGITQADADLRYVDVAGDTMTGDLTINKATPVLTLNDVAGGVASDVRFNRNGKRRWLWRLGGDAETGGNAGSSLTLISYADDGVTAITPVAMQIDRVANEIYLAKDPTQPVGAATKRYVDNYAAPKDALAYNGMQINGSFEVSQEKGSTAIVGQGFICDGWGLATSIPTFTAGVGSAGPFPGIGGYLGALHTVAIPSVAANDYLSVFQNIEGYRVGRLRWGTAGAIPLTVGFWTAHYKPGLYSIAVQNAAGDRSCTATYTHAAGGVAQYNVLTIPGCTDGSWNVGNGNGLRLMLSIMHGATYTAPAAGVWYNTNYGAAPGCVAPIAPADQIYFSGVVVLPGIEAPSAARSSLIMRPYGQELVTCQRYWEKVRGYLIANGTAGTGTAGLGLIYKVEKRAAPAAALITDASVNCVFNGVSNPTSTEAAVWVNVTTTAPFILDVTISVNARL